MQTQTQVLESVVNNLRNTLRLKRSDSDSTLHTQHSDASNESLTIKIHKKLHAAQLPRGV